MKKGNGCKTLLSDQYLSNIQTTLAAKGLYRQSQLAAFLDDLTGAGVQMRTAVSPPPYWLKNGDGLLIGSHIGVRTIFRFPSSIPF